MSTLSLVNGFHDVADWNRKVEPFDLMGPRFRAGMTVELRTDHSYYWITKTVHARAIGYASVKGFALQTDSRTLRRLAESSPLDLSMSAIVTPYEFFGIADGHTGRVNYLRVL